MELIICISIFFLISIIFVGIFYLFRGKLNPESNKIHQRLKVATSKERRSHAINIMRQRRKLSNIRWLDTLLRNIPFLQKIDSILQQSNLRYPLGVFLLISLFLAIFAFVCVFYLTHSPLLSVPVAVLLSIIPLLYIVIKKRKRMKKFEKQLPEALDMLARSLRAGHAFSGGLEMVAEEFDDPMGSEFAKIIDEISFGVTVNDALRNLAERVDVPDLKYLVVAVTIQRESGGDLAEILENIAILIRERFKLADRVLTLSAEGRLSAKILIAVPLFLAFYFFMSQPGYMQILINDPIGQVLIIFSVTIMIIGTFVMKKLIQIKV
ncbi:MAG: type II secretion system F family protein [Planctomycetota bacterium]|jgi:tight adherence protein B